MPPGASGSENGAAGWRRKDVPRGKPVTLMVDGVPVAAHEGEAVVMALAAAGTFALRHSHTAGEPRGMFCLMGVCQECVVEIDDAVTPSCMARARDGMRVTTDALRRRRDDIAAGRTAP